jgi:hypothetical protein
VAGIAATAHAPPRPHYHLRSAGRRVLLRLG